MIVTLSCSTSFLAARSAESGLALVGREQQFDILAQQLAARLFERNLSATHAVFAKRCQRTLQRRHDANSNFFLRGCRGRTGYET